MGTSRPGCARATADKDWSLSPVDWPDVSQRTSPVPDLSGPWGMPGRRRERSLAKRRCEAWSLLDRCGDCLQELIQLVVVGFAIDDVLRHAELEKMIRTAPHQNVSLARRARRVEGEAGAQKGL